MKLVTKCFFSVFTLYAATIEEASGIVYTKTCVRLLL